MAAPAPRVSICIPVYNRAREIGEALASVLAQDFTDFEIVVLDDGSTDGILAEVARFDDSRIRIEANPGNLGIPASRQRCLDLARGGYLAWLDSDDVMSPRRLSRQVAWLDRNPETATLGGWVRTFRDDGGPGKFLIKPLVHDQLAAWLLFRCCHANTTLMGRTETMRDFGFRGDFPVSEDYDLSVRLSAHHRVANLPFILTRQRQHGGRTTALSADRCRAIKTKLVVAQLERLGLAANEEDLKLHYVLTRLSRADVAADRFAERTIDWLSQISAANRKSAVYDAAALADVLQVIWAQACIKIMKTSGPVNAFACYRRFDVQGRLTRGFARNFAYAMQN